MKSASKHKSPRIDTSGGVAQLIADSPVRTRPKFWLWSKSDDIIRSDAWMMERDRIHNILSDRSMIPNVLCDIIIEYTGSVYSDSLIKLGTSSGFTHLVRHCKLATGRKQRILIKLILNRLCDSVGIRVNPSDNITRAIESALLCIDDYIPNRKIGLDQCSAFHVVLATHF